MDGTDDVSNGPRTEPPGLPTEHGNLAHLLPSHFTSDITHWLEEDTPSFDYGGFVVGSEPRSAFLLCKSPGILAGVPFVDEVFRQLNCSVTWHYPESVLLVPAKDGGKTKVASQRSNKKSSAGRKGSTEYHGKMLWRGNEVEKNAGVGKTGWIYRNSGWYTKDNARFPAGGKVWNAGWWY